MNVVKGREIPSFNLQSNAGSFPDILLPVHIKERQSALAVEKKNVVIKHIDESQINYYL